MDIRSIANAATSTVNNNIPVSLFASTGYTKGDGYKQVPSYAEPVVGPAQVQALTFSDLKKIEGLNIQGVAMAIYLRGNLYGVVRPDSKGGDIVKIADPAPTVYRGTWLIAHVLENWSNWTKCVMVYQGAA